MSYLHKYLKYKSKYLSLKKIIQKGGADADQYERLADEIMEKSKIEGNDFDLLEFMKEKFPALYGDGSRSVDYENHITLLKNVLNHINKIHFMIEKTTFDRYNELVNLSIPELIRLMEIANINIVDDLQNISDGFYTLHDIHFHDGIYDGVQNAFSRIINDRTMDYNNKQYLLKDLIKSIIEFKDIKPSNTLHVPREIEELINITELVNNDNANITSDNVDTFLAILARYVDSEDDSPDVLSHISGAIDSVRRTLFPADEPVEDEPADDEPEDLPEIERL